MPVIVNGKEFSDADMEAELPSHRDAPHPMRRAMTALVLRQVLRDEAKQLGLPTESDEVIIDALASSALRVPVATEADCRRHYLQHPEHFTVGELVEADHILFQVTERVDLDALRARAQSVLDAVLADPTRFAEHAAACSNCPSGEVGGNLGQLSRGATAPEFEKVVFAMPADTLLPHLLETRFGLHIVRVGRRVDGSLLPFEHVAASIAAALGAAARNVAWRQYLSVLVGRAKIEGIVLEGADSPLVQ